MTKLPTRKEVMQLRLLADDIGAHIQCLDQIAGLLITIEPNDEVASVERLVATDFISNAIDDLNEVYKKIKKAEKLEIGANDDDAKRTAC